MQWLHAACHLGCLHLVVALVSSSFAFCQGVKSLQSSSRTCTGLPPGAMHSKYIKKGRRTTTKPWSFEIPCRAKAWALLSREDESCVSELEPLVHKLLFSHLIPNLCNRNQMGCNCRQRETHGWLRCWNCSLKDEQEPAVTLTEATALELSMIYCPNLCPHLSPVLFSCMTQDGAAPAQGTL